jgi:hypothetical protein
MTDVTFVTYCCPKDIHKLYAPGALSSLVQSQQYEFAEIILVRQRCRDIDVGAPEIPCRVLEAEDYPDIRSEFGIIEDNPGAEGRTIGDPTIPGSGKYYWKNHCWNQLIGLKEAQTPYVVFADCDVVLMGGAWIERAKQILHDKSQILMVSPGHGGPHEYETKDISQIVFLCERERFLALNYEAPMPPGEAMGGFHYLFEGRVWRYVQQHDLRRVILQNPIVIHYAW